MILSNTKAVTQPEAGGLSGPPLFDQAYRALSEVKQVLAEDKMKTRTVSESAPSNSS